MLSSFEKNANLHALDLGFFAQNRPSGQERTNYDNRTEKEAKKPKFTSMKQMILRRYQPITQSSKTDY